MKKFIYIIMISVIIGSCGGSGGNDPTPTPEPTVNKPPTTPTMVYPSNNLLCIDNSINFQWNTSTDPDGDSITYQIQVSTDNQFSQIIHSENVSSTSKTFSLEKGISYYWRVKSTDGKTDSSYSSIFNFYTEGVGISNYLPFLPELKSPVLNSIVQHTTIKLEWKSSDVDNEDILTFEVYLGTIEDNIRSSNQGDLINLTTYSIIQDGSDSTLYSISDFPLNSSTYYYWKVIVKDGNGGETIGQVWNFKTD